MGVEALEALKVMLLVLIGFGSGIVISGAVFAFIAIIGVVPRLAQKTKTEKFIMFYEEAIIWGGIFGTTTMVFDYYFPVGKIITVIVGVSIGIFYGVLAVSLAEVLDVVPILSRRGRIQTGIKYFILSIALGKMLGSVLYYFVPGFFY